MNLTSARLVLVEVSWYDIPDIHRLHSLPEVDEYNTIGIPESEDDTRDVIRPWIEDQKNERRSKYLWKILKNCSGEFIGIAGMSMSSDKFISGEIFYKLLPSHWGNGYATETAITLIKAGFESFHLHRIEAGVATENIRSVRVLEKAAMTREGRRRKILPIRGEWRDNYHYAILEDDPRDY
ncbi:GNAT family N-acetyltransferase [Marinilabilia sp.]